MARGATALVDGHSDAGPTHVCSMSLVDDYVDALLNDTAIDATEFYGEPPGHDPLVPASGATSTTPFADTAPGVRDPVDEPAAALSLLQEFPDGSLPTTTASDAAHTHVDSAETRSFTSPMAASHRWLRVKVGEDSYALELLRVQEVVRLSPIVALRGAAHELVGVMNLRGRILPVVDLGLWLDAGCVQPDERSRIVVVERDDEMIGMLVSAVEDIVTLGRERIEPPLASSDPGAIVGIARVGAAPTVLLDAIALFG